MSKQVPALIIKSPVGPACVAPPVLEGKVITRTAEWRGRNTAYRGPMAIVCSQSSDSQFVDALAFQMVRAGCSDAAWEASKQYHKTMHKQHAYRLMGFVELVEVVSVTDVLDQFWEENPDPFKRGKWKDRRGEQILTEVNAASWNDQWERGHFYCFKPAEYAPVPGKGLHILYHPSYMADGPRFDEVCVGCRKFRKDAAALKNHQVSSHTGVQTIELENGLI